MLLPTLLLLASAQCRSGVPSDGGVAVKVRIDDGSIKVVKGKRAE